MSEMSLFILEILASDVGRIFFKYQNIKSRFFWKKASTSISMNFKSATFTWCYNSINKAANNQY